MQLPKIHPRTKPTKKGGQSSHATCAKCGAYFICTQHCPCHAMCYRTCSDIMHTSRSTRKPATLIIHGTPGITYGHAIRAGRTILIKITASHFSTLNMKFANQNMLKRILIAMLNENKADSNENSGICAEEPIAPLYKQ